MELVGNGELQQEMERLVAREGLQEQVKLTGACTPEQVRRKMERAAIFLVTSDQNEGWGAVVNEAMKQRLRRGGLPRGGGCPLPD